MVADSIERSIEIDAPPETVWDLIDEAGWWINDGSALGDAVVTVAGDRTTVVHPKHGEFHFVTEKSEPPRYAAYRWLQDEDTTSTLVELFVEDRPGGVTLRVVESGFASLSDPDGRIRWDEHTEGWGIELGLVAAAAGA